MNRTSNVNRNARRDDPPSPVDRALARGHAALEGECDAIRNAAPKFANSTLNKSAHRIARMQAAGQIENEQDARAELLQADLSIYGMD